MALNLFAPLSEQKKDVLVEFKAGRMNKDPNSKWVRPETRKGLVQLKQNSDDDLIHFIWRDRTTGNEEVDLIIFPEAATFKHLKEVPGRCYILEFKTGEKKLFFWMQNLSADKDEQNCADINKFIDNPPQPGSSGGPGGLPDISNIDQQQLLQLLASTQGGAGAGGLGNLLRNLQGQRRQQSAGASAPPARASGSPSATPASSSAAAGARQATAGAVAAATASGIQRSVLQGILSNVAARTQTQGSAASQPSLNDIVDVEHIVASGLFDNEEVVKKLAEFLPEGTPVTAENMKENVNSAQFKQAVSMFNEALRSGELSAIMASFGLSANDLSGPNATIEDFLKAIQRQTERESASAKEEKKEDMDVEKP